MWHSYQDVTHKVREIQCSYKGGLKLRKRAFFETSTVNCSLTGPPTVVIDGYTHNSTLISRDSIPLGTQLILVCQVVGLPYGTPLSYTWTCPNGPCEVEGYYGRRVYNEQILAVNTTSTSDGGTYTCQVTATGRQEANRSFIFSVSGMSYSAAVIHMWHTVCVVLCYSWCMNAEDTVDVSKMNL